MAKPGFPGCPCTHGNTRHSSVLPDVHRSWELPEWSQLVPGPAQNGTWAGTALPRSPRGCGSLRACARPKGPFWEPHIGQPGPRSGSPRYRIWAIWAPQNCPCIWAESRTFLGECWLGQVRRRATLHEPGPPDPAQNGCSAGGHLAGVPELPLGKWPNTGPPGGPQMGRLDPILAPPTC